jgi:uncharacterized protein (UPF0147 family)
MPSVNGVVGRVRDLSERDDIPSNVADKLDEAADILENDDKEISVRVNSASSILDQVSNDPNIKQHTRTEIWNIASKVESLE